MIVDIFDEAIGTCSACGIESTHNCSGCEVSLCDNCSSAGYCYECFIDMHERRFDPLLQVQQVKQVK
jgi:hypothetical protein